MGRQHIRNGLLHVTQQKTGKALAIPIHPDLQAILATVPATQMTFVMTLRGKPFDPHAFSAWFAKACDDAGLPSVCTFHGLRKAACRRLAEAGCTIHEIAAISGHATLKEVERYAGIKQAIENEQGQMRLHGWQRLWLVGTVCLGLWLMGWWPLQWAGKSRDFHFNYRWELEKDFRNPQCRACQTAPLGTLSKPSFGEPCYHISFSRQFDETVPYTLEAYDRDRSAQWRKTYLEALAFGTIGTILFSAFAYLCGWVVGWIYRGFRRA